jgi:hypothetical protein
VDSARLIINQIEIKDFEPAEFAVIITWAAKLATELNSFSTFTTKTNTLPVTRDVNRALKSPLLIDADSAMRATTKSTIDYYVGSDVVLRGYMQITKGVYNVIGGAIEFIVTPRDRDWIDGLKAITMQDLDLSAEDHIINESNIDDSITNRGSWSPNAEYIPVDVGWLGYRSIIGIQQVDASPVSSYIYYTGDFIAHLATETVTLVGCKDEGLNIEVLLEGEVSGYYNGGNVYVGTTDDLPYIADFVEAVGFFTGGASPKWRVHDFIPAMPLDILMNEAFRSVGYAIENSWVDDNLNNKYHYEYNPEVWGNGFDSRFKFSMGIKSGDYDLVGVTGTTVYPFSRETGVGHLANVNYDDTNADILANVVAGTHKSEWVAPEDCHMVVKARLLFLGEGSLCRLIARDQFGVQERVLVSYTLNADHQDFTLGAVAFVQASHTISVEVDFGGSTYTPVLSEESYFEGYQIRKIIPGMTAHMSDFQTEHTAYEWIKDVALFYNLQFFTDSNLKMVTIVPDEDKMIMRMTDWRDGLQTKNTSTITPIAILHPLKYRLDYFVDPNDFEMLRKEAISGRFAGGDIDNDDAFAKGTTNVDCVVYAATLQGPTDYYTLGGLDIPIMLGEDGARSSYESRILEVEFGSANPSQLVEGSSTQLLWDFATVGTSTTISRATFPSTLHFDSLITTQYERFLNTIRFGYIFKGVFLLDVTDAGKLNHVDDNVNAFRSRYQIKVNGVEIEAELLKVIDYQPNGDGYTIVEMICQKIGN